MEVHDLFQVAAKALIRDEKGNLFLSKDATDEWDLPGGRIHHTETLSVAIGREIKEELGVDCEILKDQPELAWTAQNKDGAWRIDLCYPVKLLSDNLVTSNENVENGYFSKEEISNLKLSPHLNKLKELL
jgi:ADP-ribose pyrophosphatase YjhB (NUDIX family)